MTDPGAAATADALDVLRSQPGHAFSGIARLLADGTLVLCDEVPATLVGARIGPLLQAGEPVWHSAKDMRLPTAWCLALGERPACIATCLIAGTDRALVTASRGTDDGHIPLHPDLLAWVAGALSSRIGRGTPMDSERRRHLQLDALVHALVTPVVFVGYAQNEVLANPAAMLLLGFESETPAPAQVLTSLAKLARDSHPTIEWATPVTIGDLVAAREVTIGAQTWSMHSHALETPGLQGRLWQFTNVSALQERATAWMEASRAQTVNRMLGGIAHEFNNLLTVVLGHADALSTSPDVSPVVRRQLEHVAAAAERGTALVAQMLGYSIGHEDGATVALDWEVPEVLALFERLHADELRQPVAFTAGEGPLRWPCDRTVLIEALNALLTNALRATREGGAISVDVRRVDGGIALRVADTGIGMPPEVLARAREPFFTTHGLAEAKGLGLSMVERIAAHAKGKLELTSGPGSGTTVTVLLPAAS